jgi:hypothetical protein
MDLVGRVEEVCEVCWERLAKEEAGVAVVLGVDEEVEHLFSPLGGIVGVRTWWVNCGAESSVMFWYTGCRPNRGLCFGV